jgi:hypothetical protein
MSNALPIVCSFFGVGSGSLGADTFMNAPFVIIVPTDTGRIYTDTNTYPQPTLRVSSPTMVSAISLFGRRTAVLNFGLTLTRLNDSLLVGMDVNRLFAVAHARFANYGFNHSIELTSGAPAFDPKNYPTTAGDLVFTSISKGAFQATLAAA